MWNVVFSPDKKIDAVEPTYEGRTQLRYHEPWHAVPPKLSPRICKQTSGHHHFGNPKLGEFTTELLERERHTSMLTYLRGSGLIKELLKESLTTAVLVPTLTMPTGQRNVGSGASHGLVVAGALHQQVSGGQGEENVDMEEA